MPVARQMSSDHDAAIEAILRKAADIPAGNASKPEGSSESKKWSTQCAKNIWEEWDADRSEDDEGARANIRKGIVSKQGTIVGDPQDAWGISIGVCKQYCGRDTLPMVFNFNRFASGSTSYLLPWLALTAQLPYETGSTGANIMSVCVGLGSPMLSTFSLMMTLFNKRWARKKFRRLIRNATGAMKERVLDAQVVVEEALQAPVRLSQRNAWLARLILLDKYTDWWTDVAESLKTTRRGVTLSLVAQLSVAAIAWILTVIGSINTKLGDTEEALVLSSGSLWIWLVRVGDGSRRRSGRDPQPIDETNEETGIEVANSDGSVALAHPSTRNVAVSPTSNFLPNPEPCIIENILLSSVAGHQRQQGPAFNYARSLTWLDFTDRLCGAFETAIQKTSNNAKLFSLQDYTRVEHTNISAACGLVEYVTNNKQTGSSTEGGETNANQPNGAPPNMNPRPIFEYPSLDEVSSDANAVFWRHVAFSIAMGLVLQWGTTGMAFYMSWSTVVTGLGCRSGSYFVYGVVASVACLTLLFSACLTHIALRGYQRDLKWHGGRPVVGSRATRCWGAAAVITRHFGQFLLIANTAWLLLISLWELVGFFDSCYCSGTELSKKDKGWILMFVGATVLKEDAQAAWGTGVAMGFVIILLSIAVFLLMSRKI
ncbi:hypothetical protein CCHL11_05621 [Colletotrichum chlorophyti]|uniref:Uncharacterized protein n=1 Tax=Colletotrichum chlorophyti TaxID=708187 RepID=A0A1Q8RTL0_9PEZI|nr:hypothetical protein CCHL11_05621 [Colletotrichum chlorophyti]